MSLINASPPTALCTMAGGEALIKVIYYLRKHCCLCSSWVMVCRTQNEKKICKMPQPWAEKTVLAPDHGVLPNPTPDSQTSVGDMAKLHCPPSHAAVPNPASQPRGVSCRVKICCDIHFLKPYFFSQERVVLVWPARSQLNRNNPQK